MESDKVSAMISQENALISPVNTYRLQITSDFTLEDARKIVPSLREQGITHVYLAPIFEREPGNDHGYHINDYNKIDEGIGGIEGLLALSRELKSHGMGLIQDIVPNHMRLSYGNPKVRDLMCWGRNSANAGYFDVDLDADPEGKLVLPALGDTLHDTIHSGHGKLDIDGDGRFFLNIYDGGQKYPVCPAHYLDILKEGDTSFKFCAPEYDNLYASLMALRHMNEPDILLEMRAALEDKVHAAFKAAMQDTQSPLGALLRKSCDVHQAPEKLLELASKQSYRLKWWCYGYNGNTPEGKDAERNYRRFFDCNELICVRVQDDAVFADGHGLILQLIDQGVIDGLRVDHIDGLLDPKKYLQKLGEEAKKRKPDIYIVAEKILSDHGESDEQLREGFAAEGETGYRFMNRVLRLFVNEDAEKEYTDIYRWYTGQTKSYAEIQRESKAAILQDSFNSEIETLTNEVWDLAQQNPSSRDISTYAIKIAIKDMFTAFDRYRTYISEEGIHDEDRKVIERVVDRALALENGEPENIEDALAPYIPGTANPASGNDHTPNVAVARAIEFIGNMMLGRLNRNEQEGKKGLDPRATLDVTMEIQKYTGPIMAKGLEDTAFYRFKRLLGLNEVGGDPADFGHGAQQKFHEANENRLRHSPREMITTATHDMKRGEDTRVRNVALSELVTDWRDFLISTIKGGAPILRSMIEENRQRPTDKNIKPPTPDDQYLLHQTVVSTWPLEFEEPPQETTPEYARYVHRIKEYMKKAVQEAKREAGWVADGAAKAPYLNGLETFVERMLSPENTDYLRRVCDLNKKLSHAGAINSLSQVTLSIVSPGVLDQYQGREIWDFSLVDPDNRSTPNFKALAQQASGWATSVPTPETLRASWRGGEVKHWMSHQGRSLRALNGDLFVKGAYSPLEAIRENARDVTGDTPDPENRITAAMRTHEHDGKTQVVIGIGPRLVAQNLSPSDPLNVSGIFNGASLVVPGLADGHELTDVYTGKTHIVRGGKIDLGAALSDLPAALLTSGTVIPRNTPVRQPEQASAGYHSGSRPRPALF